MAKDKSDETKADTIDPRDAKIAALESQLARIEGLITSGSVNAVDAKQKERSEAELEAAKIEIAKGKQQITQEAADRQFPGGKFRYRCHLADGNDLPAIAIGADNEVDAAARYLAVCGVRSSEKQVSVTKG